MKSRDFSVGARADEDWAHAHSAEPQQTMVKSIAEVNAEHAGIAEQTMAMTNMTHTDCTESEQTIGEVHAAPFDSAELKTMTRAVSAEQVHEYALLISVFHVIHSFVCHHRQFGMNRASQFWVISGVLALKCNDFAYSTTLIPKRNAYRKNYR